MGIAVRLGRWQATLGSRLFLPAGSSVLLMGMLGLCSPSFAQGPAVEKPAPEPQMTTATYGDWTLRCGKVPARKDERRCEGALIISREGQGIAAQLAIGPGADKASYKVVVLLPFNISLTRPVRVQGPAALDISWKRCVPAGCMAEGSLSAADLQRWRSFDRPGVISFRDAADRDVQLPMSFRGASQVLGSL